MTKNEKAYSVTQINKYLKAIMDEDYVLKNIKIAGEISNYRRHQAGHVYFTLKDEESAINAVMFLSTANTIGFPLKNGMSVSVTGNISVYVKTGLYQIYAKKIEQEGIGDLFIAFERLKRKLLDEGLFDFGLKKQIPQNAKSIAVITSPSGAALRDIIAVTERRNKSVRLTVFPVTVQGDTAAAEISAAIAEANEIGGFDVIIIGRGGGSIEDLWAFNEEIVARAIFASDIPLISAVGHETDFTIADFVADARAATPSVSAEIAVPLQKRQAEYVDALFVSIQASMSRIIRNCETNIQNTASRQAYRNPEKILTLRGNNILNAKDRINKSIARLMDGEQSGIISAINIIEAVSPMNVLKRGYSVTQGGDNTVIKSVSQVKPDDLIETTVEDGRFFSKVTKILGNENNG